MGPHFCLPGLFTILFRSLTSKSNQKSAFSGPFVSNELLGRKKRPWTHCISICSYVLFERPSSCSTKSNPFLKFIRIHISITQRPQLQFITKNVKNVYHKTYRQEATKPVEKVLWPHHSNQHPHLDNSSSILSSKDDDTMHKKLNSQHRVIEVLITRSFPRYNCRFISPILYLGLQIG
jgi:hypothetical protein